MNLEERKKLMLILSELQKETEEKILDLKKEKSTAALVNVAVKIALTLKLMLEEF